MLRMSDLVCLIWRQGRVLYKCLPGSSPLVERTQGSKVFGTREVLSWLLGGSQREQVNGNARKDVRESGSEWGG
jgi:hypothetical protein